MLEIKDGKKILTTPISAEDLADIHIGDIIYLNGSMTTCRDVAHRRLVEGGRELPVNVKDAAIFHAGPIIRPLADDKFGICWSHNQYAYGEIRKRICGTDRCESDHRKRRHGSKHRVCM